MPVKGDFARRREEARKTTEKPKVPEPVDDEQDPDSPQEDIEVTTPEVVEAVKPAPPPVAAKDPELFAYLSAEMEFNPKTQWGPFFAAVKRGCAKAGVQKVNTPKLDAWLRFRGHR